MGTDTGVVTRVVDEAGIREGRMLTDVRVHCLPAFRTVFARLQIVMDLIVEGFDVVVHGFLNLRRLTIDTERSA